MDKLTVKDIDVKGKRCLVRVDFNVPMKDGVMIGRGALGNYRIFADIIGKKLDRTERQDILLQIDYLKREYPERIVVNLMKHHVSAYASGRAGVAKEIRDKVHHAASYEELLAVVDEYFPQ